MSVVVLGGGPAGSAAAITLRDAGIDVTLVERLAFPRYRPGETLHPGIEPLLGRLGVLPELLDAGLLRHNGHWLEWCAPPRFVPFGCDAGGPWQGFQAPRGELDRQLLAAAVAKGARVSLDHPTQVLLEEERVVGIETVGTRIAARFVIDCTGGARWLARQLRVAMPAMSPPLVAHFGYARRSASAPDRLPMLRADSHGWTWVAQVEAQRFHWTRVTLPQDRPHKHWMPECLQDAALEEVRGADVTWRLTSRAAGPGWFLAGDAAVVLDPASSHGVVRAIMTGMMCAHLIARVLLRQNEEAEVEKFYHRWLVDWYEHDAGQLRQAYREARLFFSSPDSRH